MLSKDTNEGGESRGSGKMASELVQERCSGDWDLAGVQAGEDASDTENDQVTQPTSDKAGTWTQGHLGWGLTLTACPLPSELSLSEHRNLHFSSLLLHGTPPQV